MTNPKKHILLVDDDEDDRMFFEEALEDLGLNVTFESASTGLEAMQMLENSIKSLPDIIFLDMNMPLLSGSECLKRIRSNQRLQDLTVIMYSTSLHPETVDQLYDLGADYYICKPGDYGALKSTIAAAIHKAEISNKERVSKTHFVINP